MKFDSSEFETLFSELNKRTIDYYGEGTFITFVVRAESYIKNFKSEYFKNLSLLSNETKADYINYLNSELDKIREPLQDGDSRYLNFLDHFQITEHDLLKHQSPTNELYRILSNELDTLKFTYKGQNPGRITYDEIVDMLRIFYKQFAHQFFKQVDSIVNSRSNDALKNSSNNSKPTKIVSNSFGFSKLQNELLKRIYYELILDTGAFIDHDTTSERDFIDILTGKNYNNVGGKIKFQCETTQAAHILSLMKQFSPKFTPSKIEASNKFFTESGTPITASNLSKSKSSSPLPKQHDYIEAFFAKLILKQ